MLDDLGRRAASLTLDDLTPKARERLLLALLANITVGIAGPKYTVIPEPKGEGPYRLLSGTRTARAADAAFYNAAAMHARTQDDFDPIGKLHLGVVVLPALLAEADGREISGRHFLSALAAGYMIGAGLSHKAAAETTPKGLRATSLYSPFAAAAAVARARKYSAEQAASAMALATAYAAGTTQAWMDGSDEWQLHTAQGARAGIETNDLVAAGVKGGAHALDGPSGFFYAHTGKTFTLADIAADLDPSQALELNAIKRYPVSGICQSVVLAAERAAKRIKDPAAISAITLHMNPSEMRYPGNLNRGPFRAFGDRLMSAAFCAASPLAHGGFVFADFHKGENPVRDRLVAATEIKDDASIPLLSSRLVVRAGNETIEERVANSRAEVAIEWDSVDPWAAAIWEEAGRSRADYQKCRDAIAVLDKAMAARVPF